MKQIKGLLDKKKRKYKHGDTFAQVQKRWRIQQRNSKLDGITCRQSWKQYWSVEAEMADKWK